MKKLFAFLRRKSTPVPAEAPAHAAPDRPARTHHGKKRGKKRRFAALGQPEAGASARPDAADEASRALPGSDGEHQLQEQYGSRSRALNFYEKQVLDYLAPAMREFIARQEFLFIATADRRGECDCTPKFGQPGFIRVLDDQHLAYPEYRGNGVHANAGNLTENPHIGLLMIDFTRDTVGLHVNGRARLVENDELRRYADWLPPDLLEEMAREGRRRPERWVMVEVEEAYIQCSKHIPLMRKADKAIHWGTDDAAAKGGDYFGVSDLPRRHAPAR